MPNVTLSVEAEVHAHVAPSPNVSWPVVRLVTVKLRMSTHSNEPLRPAWSVSVSEEGGVGNGSEAWPAVHDLRPMMDVPNVTDIA